MNDNINLTDKEFRLLSAYLDGVLTKRERARADSLLASKPEAVQILENLRNLKSLLRLLPVRKVPHHYTFTQLEARAMKPGWAVRGLRILSGLSAAALAMVLAFDFLLPFVAPTSPATIESVSIDSARAIEPKAASVDGDGQPTIFSFQTQPQGLGMGGGGDGIGVPPGQSRGLILPDISIKLGEPFSQAGIPAESTEDELEMEAAAEQAELNGNTGPILGVQVPGLRGQIIAEETSTHLGQAPPSEIERFPSYFVVEIALLALSLVSALSAFIIWRRKRRAR